MRGLFSLVLLGAACVAPTEEGAELGMEGDKLLVVPAPLGARFVLHPPPAGPGEELEVEAATTWYNGAYEHSARYAGSTDEYDLCTERPVTRYAKTQDYFLWPTTRNCTHHRVGTEVTLDPGEYWVLYNGTLMEVTLATGELRAVRAGRLVLPEALGSYEVLPVLLNASASATYPRVDPFPLRGRELVNVNAHCSWCTADYRWRSTAVRGPISIAVLPGAFELGTSDERDLIPELVEVAEGSLRDVGVVDLTARIAVRAATAALPGYGIAELYQQVEGRWEFIERRSTHEDFELEVAQGTYWVVVSDTYRRVRVEAGERAELALGRIDVPGSRGAFAVRTGGETERFGVAQAGGAAACGSIAVNRYLLQRGACGTGGEVPRFQIGSGIDVFPGEYVVAILPGSEYGAQEIPVEVPPG